MRRSLICLLFLLFILSFINHKVQAEDLPLVSVFDVKAERVVKVLPLTTELTTSVKGALKASPTLFKGFSMEPHDGLVLHIPFVKPMSIKHALYPTAIREIYLFLEPDKKLRALIFFASTKLRPIVVDLNDDVNKFMENNEQI